jgi:hypothetical protein
MNDGIMNQSAEQPRIEVVEIEGEPWWQVCCGGVCCRDRCGQRAIEKLRALCRSKGLPVPQ